MCHTSKEEIIVTSKNIMRKVWFLILLFVKLWTIIIIINVLELIFISMVPHVFMVRLEIIETHFHVSFCLFVHFVSFLDANKSFLVNSLLWSPCQWWGSLVCWLVSQPLRSWLKYLNNYCMDYHLIWWVYPCSYPCSVTFPLKTTNLQI